MDTYKVYVKTDEADNIIAVNSCAFLYDTEGWTQIEEGCGDRYHHAQGHYLPKPIVTDEGAYRYKLANGEVVERTVEEMAADIAAISSPPLAPTPYEQLREDVDFLLIAEMQREGLL